MAELAFCEPCEPEGPLVRAGTSPFSDWDGGSAGGKPAWLSPVDLPGPGALKCPSCSGTLRFLLQAYCPVDDNDDDAALGGKDRAFHRMVYLFVCARPGCVAKGSVLALRCQLPKTNPVIAFKPDAVLPEPAPGGVCTASGMPCDGPCSSCGSSAPSASADTVRCCWPAFDLVLGSGEEDEEDEEAGDGADVGDAASAGEEAAGGGGAVAPSGLAAAAASAAGEEDGGRRLAALEGVGATGDDDTSQGDLVRAIGGDERLAQVAAQLAEDECFAHFEVEMKKEPEQVMRYARWKDAEVLWASDSHRPAGAANPTANDDDAGATAPASPVAGASVPAACKATALTPGSPACLAVAPKGCSGLASGCDGVPVCDGCGAPRRFELQVMPQLIHFLQPVEAAPAASAAEDGARATAAAAADAAAGPHADGDELDFQTLVVYTCSKACKTGQAGLGAYSREFVWVQTE